MVFIDLTGNRYKMVLVVSRNNPGERPIKWNCLCDCGKTFVADGSNLRRFHYKSCGCNRAAFRKVKYLDRRMYEVWKGMKARCRDVKHASYKRYGGKGVIVCDEWSTSFKKFYEWSMSNGYQPGLTIDRIDNDGNYCPDNCRWVTHTENCRTSPQSKLTMEIANEIRKSTSSVKELAIKYNVSESNIYKVKTNKSWV